MDTPGVSLRQVGQEDGPVGQPHRRPSGSVPFRPMPAGRHRRARLRHRCRASTTGAPRSALRPMAMFAARSTARSAMPTNARPLACRCPFSDPADAGQIEIYAADRWRRRHRPRRRGENVLRGAAFKVFASEMCAAVDRVVCSLRRGGTSPNMTPNLPRCAHLLHLRGHDANPPARRRITPREWKAEQG